MLSVKRIYAIMWMTTLLGVVLIGCAGNESSIRVEGGDPDRGAQAIQRQGCHSCHRIPGIRGVNSYVGPPLDGWSERQYIAGNLENNPDNLIAWIMDPQSIEPGTAMPNMGLDEQEARDIAAYLFTLQPERADIFSEGE